MTEAKYRIKICLGLMCHKRGASAVLARVRDELGLSKAKRTTDDGLFSVETEACLAVCGRAPAMTINDDVYPLMTPDDAALAIARIKDAEAEGACR